MKNLRTKHFILALVFFFGTNFQSLAHADTHYWVGSGVTWWDYATQTGV